MEEQDKKINVKKFKNTRVKTSTVFQMEATECGAASLAMVLGYYGCNIPLEKLRVDCGVSRNGSTASSIMDAAEKYGLECKGYRKEVDELLETETPCIIHWQMRHFVVYEGIKHGKIYLNDPATGKRVITYDDLNDSFSGVVLTFKPTDKLVKTKKENHLLELIKKRIMNEKSSVLALLLAGLILVVPGITIPIISKVFIDDILLGGNTDWIISVLVFFCCTILFQMFFTWLRASTLNKLDIKISLLSSQKFIEHMFKLPINFFEQRHVGDLSNRIDNNNKVNDFLSGKLAETILNIFVAIFYFVLLIFFNPLLTVIGVIGLATNLLINYNVSKKNEDLYKKYSKDTSKLIGVMFSGIKMSDSLKAAGAENKFVSKILGHYSKAIESEQTISQTGQILSSIPAAISKVFDIVILMIGGIMIINGDMTVGDLTAFTTLMASLTAPINALAGFFTNIHSLMADIDRVQDIEHYEEAPQFKKRSYKKLSGKLNGIVELKDVSFGYNPLTGPLIKDYNLYLEPGKTIALVGASGCGKSTVGKLVSGLTDAWSGQVLFDGMDIRSIDPLYFTSSVATVSQDINIFSGTIKDNISLWNNQIRMEDIVRAAKDACIHNDIIKKDNAYDEILSEGGGNLSGGQRQRIEIARALATDPSILVLDEATSALDAITEEQVTKNIKRRGCSAIIIAHRLSTIRDCDEIIVMNNGLIVERGTHDQLVKNKGPYYELIKTM